MRRGTALNPERPYTPLEITHSGSGAGRTNEIYPSAILLSGAARNRRTNGKQRGWFVALSTGLAAVLAACPDDEPTPDPVVDPPVLSAPSDVRFTAGDGQVTIAFVRPPDALRVEIRRSVGDPPASIIDGASVCEACTSPTADDGLMNGIAVGYAVFAVYADGVSDAVTGVATPRASDGPPGPVTAATFDAGDAQVTLQWTPPADADLSRVVIRRAAGTTPPASIEAGTDVCDPCASPYVDGGLPNRAAVSYAIYAVDDAGLVSSPVTGTATPTPTVGLDVRPPRQDCRAFTPPPVSGEVTFVRKFPGVSLDVPTGMVQRPGDNTRWYVLERAGRIISFPNEPDVTNDDVRVALDLSDVTHTQWDCSVASLAFPPDFATSNRAYVGYCYLGPETDDRLQIRYSRFTSADGGLTFDRSSEELIVALDFPHGQLDQVGLHAANAARFGPDGYYYVAIGDGGPQGRVGGEHAQDTNDLRGKLLRIDVSDLSRRLPNDAFVPGRQRVAAVYPANNPFVGGGGHPAIYALGFRNPWQWHFDRATGNIWIGDVGNSIWEEVNWNVQRGGNYGWGFFEGFDCTNGHTEDECADPSLIPPLLDYSHGNGPQRGNAVTGGLVYRGTGVPSLTGAYIFGDSSGGRIWAVRDVDSISTEPKTPVTAPPKELLVEGQPVSSFAEDQNGELFATVLYGPGRIVALEAVPQDPEPGTGGPPPLLSQTGCVDPNDPQQPSADLIPYTPSAQLWSDGASKRRWFTVPDGERITVQSDGDFEFPVGSVLVKEFSLAGRPVETRFFVRQEGDGRWAGYSYQWNEAGTDATLVPAEGASRIIGVQTWQFPSRAQCMRCHTNVAGVTLGLEIGQLNDRITYLQTGRVAHQMETLEHIDVVDLSAFTGERPRYPSYDDDTFSVADRARAYLHVNCSGCHRAGGPTFTRPDFRFANSFEEMEICNVRPTISDLEELIVDDPRLLAPGDPSRSVLFVRMSTEDTTVSMPPLARLITDPVGRNLLSSWISDITACPDP